MRLRVFLVLGLIFFPAMLAAQVGGATAWAGKSGSVEVGAAIPLATWPSVFRLGDGELVALVGKSEVGLGLGHRFRSVQMTMGRATVGAALGVGFLLPYGASSCTANCHTGLAAARPAVFVTLPIGASSP